MNILEKASDVGATISNALSTASSKKEFIGKQIINAILLFIILLVFGCLDFATLTFHIEKIFTLSYWATVISKSIAGICAFNIGINIMWETELKKDKILADAIEKYNKLITYKQIDFEYFVVHIFNPKEKKKAYISQINHEIYKLNKFSKAKDRLLYSSDLQENQEAKKKNRYCIKRKELEDLKKDEFIEKNLDSLKVKYLEVDPTIFELEIDGSPIIKGVKTKGNVGAGKVKASANVLLGMVGFSMFTASIGLEINQEQFANQMVAFWHYLLKCAEDVGIVLWQLSRGMIKARKIISDEVTQAYVGRNKVLQDYIEWRLKTKQPDTLIHTELKQDQEIVVEMTEDELLKNLQKAQ